MGDGCTLSDWRIQRQQGNSPICDKRLCDWVVKVGRGALSRTKCEPRDGRSVSQPMAGNPHNNEGAGDGGHKSQDLQQ